MIKSILLLSVVLLMLFNSCNKTDSPIPSPIEIEDEWPNFVDTGANIVAYKVDGKIRINKNLSTKYPELGTITCMYFKDSIQSIFYLETNRITDTSFYSLSISIHKMQDTGVYKLIESELSQGVFSIGTNPNNTKPYVSSQNDTGYLHISKIDTSKRIITGDFSFRAKYYFGIDEKKITQGRFDLKY